MVVGLGYGFYALYEMGLSVWLVILISIYALTSIFVVILFLQNRHPSAKLSWTVIMIVLPIFGHIIFFAFGQRFKYRKPQKEYLKKDSFKEETYKELPNTNPMNAQSNISKRGIYNAEFEIFKNGIHAYKKLFSDMRKAKEYIFIQQYIIHAGEIYDEFKDIITTKAKSGVKVKLIVDDFGRWAMPWHEIKLLQDCGIEIQIFGKVRFPFISSKNGYRTHRKQVIVDGKIAHVGGMNIGDEYANITKGYGKWADIQVSVQGEYINSLLLLFIDDWKIVSGETLDIAKYRKNKKHTGSKAILVEDSPEVIEPIISNSIAHWISSAQKEVTLATPYFIPTTTIFNAIKHASMSGVKVRIYIPHRADKKSVLLASLRWAEQLIPYGVEFIQTNDQFLHSKVGVFDNKYAYFGSANIDMRSAYSQFEFVTMVSGKVVKDITNIFKGYEKNSKIVTDDNFKHSWIVKKLIRLYTNLMSPIL